jgi:fluoride exporter
VTEREGFDRFPIDPDVDLDEDRRHHPGGGAEPETRGRWPRFRLLVLAVIFAGGCVGGLARYAVTQAWPSGAGRFPWATLGVNLVGAFVLAVVVVVVTDDARSPAWVRPLIGTGFCGALTTFSSVVVAADRLIAHGHASTAVGYLILSIVAGLLAAGIGLLTARAVIARRPAAPVAEAG